MVLEISKYSKYIKKNFFNRDRLNFIILYVTSKCNSFCKTCFFHKHINNNPDDDLTLSEYSKISEKLGRLSVVLLSGGEPFLRKDLGDICGIFIKNNGVDTLAIPTNGILTDEIVKTAGRLAEEFPRTVISVNPSLDGMQKYHDMVRGVEGNFAKAINTIKHLEGLKKKYRNLQIVVNSVVNMDNIEDLKELMAYLLKYDLDYHAFEIIRGEWKDASIRRADLNRIKTMHGLIVKNRNKYIKNVFERIVVIGSLKYIHEAKERFLSGGKWPFVCSAGRSIAVIYPNGEVSLCELRPPIASLRDRDYDTAAILRDKAALEQMGQIEKNRCGCTHVCFLNASVARDWKSTFKILYHFLRP